MTSVDGPGRGVMLSTFDSLSAGIPPVAGSAAQSMERYVVGGSVAAVAESLAPFRDLGMEDFVIYPMAPDPSSRYEEACAVYDLLGVGA